MRRTSQLMTAVVLALGASAAPAVATPGDLDPTFAGGGVAVKQFGASPAPGSAFYASARQPDGKLLAGGAVTLPTGDEGVLLVRYLPNGALDPGFGPSGTGVVALQLGAPKPAPQAAPAHSGVQYHGIALQPDGRIVIAGDASDVHGEDEVLVARFLADGSDLDASFASGGKYVAQLGGVNGRSDFYGVALQPDGKIVATGGGGPANGELSFVAERFTTAGKPDTGFGTGGIVKSQLGGGAPADQFSGGVDAIALGGGVVICGGATTASGLRAFLLTRLTDSGEFDPNFGTGGVTIKQVSDTLNKESLAFTLGVQSDGHLVLGGPADVGTTDARMGLARFTSGGVLDPSFGNGGTVLSQPSPFSSPFSEALGLAIQPDDRVLVSGDMLDLGGHSEMVIERYSASGALDGSFHAVGIAKHQFGGGAAPDSGSYSLLLQPGGKIVDVGHATDASGRIAGYVARYLSADAVAAPVSHPVARPHSNPPPSNVFRMARSSVKRDGTIVLSLIAPGPGVFSVKARTKCKRACRARTVMFGSRRVTVHSQGTVKVRLHPRKAVRRALKRGRRLKVAVAVKFQSALGGAATTRHRTVTVKRARPKTRRHPR